MTELDKEIERLVNEYNVSSNEIFKRMLNVSKKEAHAKRIAEIEKNKKYVGKCYKQFYKPALFPPMYKYYKVISNVGYDSYCVQCLRFDEHPTYWFDYKDIRMESADQYLTGEFDFSSFEAEDVFVNDLKECEEISRDEFDEAAKRYLDELLNLNWVAYHNRTTEIWPTDERWLEDDREKA